MDRGTLVRVGVLVLTLLVFGGVADRSLVERERAAVEASRAREEENSELTARTVAATLLRIEQSVSSGEVPPGVAMVRLSDASPLRAPAPSAIPYRERSEEDLLALTRSSGSTGSGLPEAVVAAVALGRPDVSRDVSDRLLSGRLPARPEDLPYLAGALGSGADPRVTSLLLRLRREPPSSMLPAAPTFRRELRERDTIEGWARSGHESWGYEIPVEALIDLAGFSGRVFPSQRVPGSRDEAGREIVGVSDVEGLALAVARTDGTALRVQVLRTALWLAVFASIAGLAAVFSGLRRERRALAREKAFLTGVTHELRTPLAAVRLFGERLAEGRGDPKAYGSLITVESKRLEELVERVLATTRADEKPTIERVDPGELLRSAVRLASARAEQRQVALDLDEAPLPEALWDAEAVRQAVLNLLDNAIKHGRKGGHVQVRTAVEDGWVRLSVTDDGPGIGVRERKRIFGRFERGATEATGTGLGLFIVERIARAHGGRVDLETQENRGATFTLVLPLETHP